MAAARAPHTRPGPCMGDLQTWPATAFPSANEGDSPARLLPGAVQCGPDRTPSHLCLIFYLFCFAFYFSCGKTRKTEISISTTSKWTAQGHQAHSRCYAAIPTVRFQNVLSPHTETVFLLHTDPHLLPQTWPHHLF